MRTGTETFAEPTRTWFSRAFGAPTDVQRRAWPAIAAGRDVLAIAPTGSGKTLAAFLAALDRLMVSGTDSVPRRRGVRVLYVSPLKALAADVARNLMRPLDGIAAVCRERGLPAPAVTVGMRTGDTAPRDRRRLATHPPDILVTTPESLYLLLTSKARETLRGVGTVIVDEVHALAGTKRGAHLALSLERLDALVTGEDLAAASAGDGRKGPAPRPPQRIGLSATVRPPAEAARFLGGVRPVDVIDASAPPAMEIRVVEPLADMLDLQSANVPARAGGVDASDARPISGVTPAMRRLARARGLDGTAPADRQGRPASGPVQAIVGAAGDGHGGMGSPPAGAAGSVWPAIERSVLDEVLAHRTTLVFVNSRGLAERLTARLNDLYTRDRQAGDAPGAETPDPGSPEGREGFARHYDAVVGGTTQLVGGHGDDDVIAMAHHGSVSKDRRRRIEGDLKHGRLRCVVATGSLELGIDMGSVDLVIQIAPPPSVASGLQRVGRADHRVGGVSHALIYPLTREQIAEAGAAVEAMAAGDIEPLAVPRSPLDILAQQTVAAAAMGDLDPDRWYRLVRRAAPFASLGRKDFDATMGMLTGAYAGERFSAFRPPLMRNETTDAISARPGAQRLAVTSGGTIPDRGLYTVVLPEADAGRGPRRVGELDEEMVYESRIGDVITLGTSTWRIREITRDRVIVDPAPGRTARLPFWHGDGPGRSAVFGRAKGRFLRRTTAGLDTASDGGSGPRPRFVASVERRLRDDGLDDNAIANLAGILAEQRDATGAVPDDRRLVLECCPDEEGDWRVLLHSPYGRRIHEPWALAIDARLRERHGFDGQTYAADDGIVLRLPDGVLPDGDVADRLRDLVLFDPDELASDIASRIDGTVLYAARFRECAARSLFLPRTDPGRRVPLWQQRLRAAQLLEAARTHPGFPLLFETARECLQDVYDMPALRALMTGLASGTVALDVARTDRPSPFAENLLFGYVGQVMYQYDLPQAERSASLPVLDPERLERLLGSTDMTAVLDPRAIAQVSDELGRRTFWNELAADDAAGRVARYAGTHGPFPTEQAARDLGLDADVTERLLESMRSDGTMLRGRFTQDSSGDQWLHRDVFLRIRRRSRALAREAIRPVAPAVFQRFLLDRQGVGPVGGERAEGSDGLLRVLEQLDGVALPADVWEREVLPARVRDYRPDLLDELVASGEVVWTGVSPSSSGPLAPGTVAFHPADSPLAAGTVGDGPERGDSGGRDDEPSALCAAILEALASGGAYRADRLAAMARSRLSGAGDADPQVDPATGEIVDADTAGRRFADALWTLVWQGRVTCGSFAPVRALEEGQGRTVRAPARAGRRRVRLHAAVPASLGGLWMAVGAGGDPTERTVALAETLLDRNGVAARPLADADGIRGGFGAIYPILRGMEERGSLVRGMFVDGFGAAQFADRAVVDALRARAADDGPGRAVVLGALDPANLAGTAIPWPDLPEGEGRPTRRAGSLVVLVRGMPLFHLAVRSGHLLAFAAPDDGAAGEGLHELARFLRRLSRSSVTVRDVNGTPAARSPLGPALRKAGFVPAPSGMVLYR